MDRRIWLALSLVWLLALASGFGLLWKYKMEPGEAEGAPAAWPETSGISPSGDHPTLVLFAHPQCPCTRASIAELARLMSRFRGQLSAKVIFLRPGDVGSDWEATDLWERASAIPGVTTVRDDEGVEAARFRATTSGATVLYDAKGRLLFSGGITSARGHEGDSFGVRRISSLLLTGAADRGNAPVYGCSLAHRVAAGPTDGRNGERQ
jgi:hypothetical protein